MANLFSIFKDLIPSAPLLVGRVTYSVGDSHTITLVDGGQIVARGKANHDDAVFVRDGVIEGTAPGLIEQVIEV